MARKLELQPEAFSQRLANLQQAMAGRGLEGLIVFGLCPGRTGDLTYLTNFRPGPARNFGFQGAGGHALVLAAEGPGLLVSPLAQPGEGLTNVAGLKAGMDLGAELAAAVRELGLATAKLGVAGSESMPVTLWLALTKALGKAVLEPADELLREQRAIKSLPEVELLGEAAGVGRQAVQAGVEAINPGVGERQLALAMLSAA